MQFQPGRSGNPAGKVRGTRNKASLLLDRMAAADAGDVLRAVLDKAKTGNVDAASLILQRLWPARKPRIRCELPEMHTVADLPAALGAIIAAIGRGEISPEEGAQIGAVLEQQRRAIELTEIEARLRQVEEKLNR